MTDSASLGRAVLAIDVDRSAFDAELQRIRQEVERFAPNFGGLDQVLRGVAQNVTQLEQALQRAGQQAEGLGRAAQRVGQQQQQGFQQASQAARRYLEGVEAVNAQLRRLQQTPLNLAANTRGAEGDQFSQARGEVERFTSEIVNGQRALANTTAAVSQQARAFASLAANTSTATASFRNFVQAEEIANQRQSGRQTFDRLSALESLYRVGAGGQSGFRSAADLLQTARNINGVSLPGDLASGAGRLGARSDNTPLTPAVLENFIGLLSRARDNTNLTGDLATARQLTVQIERLNQLLNRLVNPLQPGQSVVPPQRLMLPPGDPNGPAFSGGAIPAETPQMRRRRLFTEAADRATQEDVARRAEIEQAELNRRRQALRELTFRSGGPLGPGGGPPGGGPPRGPRFGNALGQGLIGGFFPLLFGQPPAAAVGGGLGGFLGGLVGGIGGFAGGLVGTALGTAFDANLQSGVRISEAVRDPIKQFGALKEAAALSSKAVERNVESLISQGRTAEATALIQQDLARSFGDVASFRAYQEAQDELARTFERVKVSLASLVAGPLTGLLGTIEKFLAVTRGASGAPGTPISPGRLAPLNRVNASINASPENRQEFEEFVRSRGRRLTSRGRIAREEGEDFGQTVAVSRRLREEFGLSRGVLNGPVITDPFAQDRLSQAAAAAANTRLQRLRGSVAFFQSRGNGLASAERELQAFDADRANRLAGVGRNERAGVEAQLVQERYQLELRIAAERRQQALLDEQSAGKLLALQEQTAILRRTPLISDRDARLLQEQANVNEAESALIAARRAASQNPDDPALRRNATEAAGAFDRAQQVLANQQRERNLDLARARLDAGLQLRSLRERGGIADLAPGLSGLGRSVLSGRAGLNDVAGDFTSALQQLGEAPGNEDRQRAAAVAAERLRTAGKEFRSDLTQAFQTAQREVQQLQRGLRDAVFSLAERETARGPGSLNRLLPQPLIAVRDQAAFQRLLPQFRDAKQFVRDSTGNQNFDLNFSGPVAAVNQQILEFIRAARPEQNLQEDLVTATVDLTKANNSLATIVEQMNKTLPDALSSNAAALKLLAEKDWNVYVNSGGLSSGQGNPPSPTANTLPPATIYSAGPGPRSGNKIQGYINGYPIYG